MYGKKKKQIQTKKKIIIVLKNCHNIRSSTIYTKFFFFSFSALNGIFILCFVFILFSFSFPRFLLNPF